MTEWAPPTCIKCDKTLMGSNVYGMTKSFEWVCCNWTCEDYYHSKSRDEKIIAAYELKVTELEEEVDWLEEELGDCDCV